MKKLYAIITVIIAMQTLNAQWLIDDFENWDTTNTACYETDLLTLGVDSPVGGELPKWTHIPCGWARTTDSYSGNYALLIYTWYVTAPGMGMYGDSITSAPYSVQGMYRFLRTGPHQARAFLHAVLTHWSGTTRDTVAHASSYFDSTDSYVPFELEFMYMSFLFPDSFFLEAWSEDDSSSHSGLVSNLFFIDQLVFSNSPLSNKEPDSMVKFRLYPNPVSDELFIENQFGLCELRIYNSYGKLVLNTMLEDRNRIVVSDLPTGCYYYQAAGGMEKMSGKFIRLDSN